MADKTEADKAKPFVVTRSETYLVLAKDAKEAETNMGQLGVCMQVQMTVMPQKEPAQTPENQAQVAPATPRAPTRVGV